MVELINSYISINNATPIEITDKENDLPPYLDYSITYSDDSPILAKHELKANTFETYKVRVEFKKDIEESDLPREEVNIKLSINPEIVQTDGTEKNPHSDYVITFDTDGGSNVESIDVEHGNTIGELPTPTKEGFYLDGWYTEPEGGDKVEPDYVPTGDKKIYARWKKSVASINTEDNLTMNKGTTKTILINNSSEIEETYAFSSNDPLIVSVSNVGVVTANGIGETNVVIIGNTSQQTKTIHIEVTRKQEYLINLDPNGGTINNNSIFVEKGQAIANLPTPTRTDYIFDGWYTNLLNGIKIEDGYVPERDMELIAKWIEKPSVNCTFEIPSEDDEYFDEEEFYRGYEYTNGQYVYRYMQENNGSGWDEIHDYNSEGWGVALIDKESTAAVTTPLCTTINDRPIISMANMFNGSNAVSIDTSSFITNNVTNMNNMFSNTQFTTIDVSNLNTSNVNRMNEMFSYTKVKKIDLRNFDTSNISEMSGMFEGSNVNDLIIDNLNLSSLYINDDSSSELFKNTQNLERISAQNLIISSSFRKIFSIPSLKSIDVTGWDLSNTTDIQGLFAYAFNLSKIKGLNTWNTSNIENMSRLFFDCKSITELDLNGFESNNLNNINSMFYGCDNLEKLDLTGFNIITNINDSYNFLTTNKELELIIDDWNYENSSELPSIIDMFPHAKTISSKNWKLSEDASGIFKNKNDINLLTNIDVTGWDLSNTSNISSLFENNTELIEIVGLETWDTSNITNMELTFHNCSSLIEFNDIRKWDTSNVTNMSSMFSGCSSLTEIDISNFNTDNLNYVNEMFMNCSKLKTLNITNFNIASLDSNSEFVTTDEDLYVIADNWEFEDDIYTNLLSILDYPEKISARNWILPSLVYELFSYDDSAKTKEIDVTNWNLSNTTSLYGLFEEAEGLTTIKGMDTWDTSNITDMSYMFEECNSLTSIDVSNFDTSNVTTMYRMFAYNDELTIIDISGFDTTNVEDMNDMFYECPKLTTIYATDSFNTNNVSNSDYMFEHDELLVGGAGTTYNENKIDKEYAHLDGGVSSPGYFSERGTLKVVFNPNGGSTPISNIFVNIGSEVGELPVPTKSDGIFVGWYTNLIGGTQVETSTIINSNVTFYARWRTSIGGATFQNEKIILSPGTNSNIIITNENEIDETYTYASLDTNIASVNSTGIVSGVNIGTTTITVVGDESNQTKNILIIVREDPDVTKYTITYIPNGGTISINNKKVIQGEKIGKLATPIKEGYEFVDWYTGLTDGTYIDEDYIPECNMTIYARWKESPKYTLTFNSNGGVTDESSRKLAKGETVGPLPIATRDNYVFIGWYTALDNGIKIDLNYTIDDDNTVHARWIKSINNLTIPSNINTKVDESKTISITSIDNCEDYTIYSNDNSIATIDENGKVIGVSEGITTLTVKGNLSNITRRIVIFVINDNIQSYTLTFNPDGGELDELTRVVYENMSIGDLPVPTKENNYFGGWKDENNNYYTSSTIPTRNVTLTAVWNTTSSIARINNTYYSSIQSAINSSQNGDTIILMGDTNERINNNKNITLNLDHYTLKGKITNDSSGTLTVLSGKIENYETVIENNGNLIIGTNQENVLDGVDITNTNTYPSNSKINSVINSTNQSNQSNLTFNKGTITIEMNCENEEINTYTYAINVEKGNVYLNGGTINATVYSKDNNTNVDYNYGINVKNGNVDVNNSTINIYGKGEENNIGAIAINVEKGNVTFNSGKLNLPVYDDRFVWFKIGIYCKNGVLTMNGGEIIGSGGLSGNNIIINDGTMNISACESEGVNGGQIRMNGGTIKVTAYGSYCRSYGLSVSTAENVYFNGGTVISETSFDNDWNHATGIGSGGGSGIKNTYFNGGRVLVKSPRSNGIVKPIVPVGRTLIETTDSNGYLVYSLD